MKDLANTNNEKIELIYDILAGIMAVIAVVIVVLEFSDELSVNTIKFVKILDDIIYIAFLVDYIGRFIISKNKRIFFINNLIDLIAILPFQFIPYLKYGSTFKLIRVGTYVLRLFGNITEILFTNGLIYVICVVIVIILLSAMGILIFEKNTNEGIEVYGDALWVSIVTITSVGYGDIVLSTIGGRVIACILMITGIVFLGILASSISTFYLSKVEKKALTDFEKENDAQDLNYLNISDLSPRGKKKIVDYYNYLRKNEK